MVRVHTTFSLKYCCLSTGLLKVVRTAKMQAELSGKS